MFQVFRRSRSSCGLYARQKWLGEGETEAWRRDFQLTVTELMEGQSPNGSWDLSFIKTVQRLFGLHLTVRNGTKEIKKALGWMVEHALLSPGESIYAEISDIRESSLEGLPLVPGDPYFFMCSAVLFLSTIFGNGNDEHVVKAYETLAGKVLNGKDILAQYADMNNILRAFVVHPEYADNQATTIMVENLAELQDSAGYWPKGVPFYQTLNALGHLAFYQADQQLDRAFLIVRDTQNPDGTWGETQKEWNTFLVIHALRNKKKL